MTAWHCDISWTTINMYLTPDRSPCHLSFYRLDALPAAQPTTSNDWRQNHTLHTIWKFCFRFRLTTRKVYKSRFSLILNLEMQYNKRNTTVKTTGWSCTTDVYIITRWMYMTATFQHLKPSSPPSPFKKTISRLTWFGWLSLVLFFHLLRQRTFEHKWLKLLWTRCPSQLAV